MASAQKCGGHRSVVVHEKSPGLHQLKLLLVLERRRSRDGLEMVVERRGAHMHESREVGDGDRFGEIVADPCDDRRDPAGVAIRAHEVAQRRPVVGRQEPVVDLTSDERRKDSTKTEGKAC